MSSNNSPRPTEQALDSAIGGDPIEKLEKQHAEFGPLENPFHLYASAFSGSEIPDPVADDPPYFVILTIYISFIASLYNDFESFYTRRMKQRINDYFERPTTGVPRGHVVLLDRTTKDNIRFRLTGTVTNTLNLSSYNYFGFAQSEGPYADTVEETLRIYESSMAGSYAGSTKLLVEVEDQIARLVGKNAAIIFPSLVESGCLILSDELNHASIRFGARLSGAAIEVFSHNNMARQLRTHGPWKKILVMVEGLFSMEGTMCNLPRILELKRKYNFYFFMDEAHSIGAIGGQGRGACDYLNVDPAEVDILMGTFTKSFRANGAILLEAPALPILAQISSSLRLLANEDPFHPSEGRERLQRLMFNSRYLQLGLKRLDFIVYGHDDCPIVPLMLYHSAKMSGFSKEMLRRKISVVVVTYPATALELSCARLCVSAAHTKDDLDRMLKACDEVGEALQLKFSSGIAGGLRETRLSGVVIIGKTAIELPRWTLEEVIERGTRDAKLPLY
ncbi:pyridoxal phosphate-dependent transferase [Aspergillus cavernicola]|uniref:Pyridoxal phosphate-dependent transferase n=1 Tax=Aspergillus cavernicola TaxID=176166 RepID=A0ABR4IGQ5_9EURO